MVVAQIVAFARDHWPSVIPVLVLLWLVNNKYGGGLNKYPGPALAALSDFWRFWDVHRRRHQHTQIALHRQHGDVVRLGPRLLSFADPRAIRDIYGLNSGFYKTDFYPVQNNIKDGVRIQSLFSTRDEAYHARFRRCVNSAFSMSTLVSYEGFVDNTTQAFLAKTHDLFCAPAAQSCDFARWLQFFAFDVIGDITFQRRFGFIDKFKDIDGIVDAISDNLKYAGEIGQIPWVDRYLWRKNPIKMWLMRNTNLFDSSNAVARFASLRSAERREELAKLKESDATADNSAEQKLDFLSRFTLSQKAHPEFMTDFQVLAATSSLINAGSDTTAISLSSVFYFLLKNPRAYDKVMKELDEAAERDDTFSAVGDRYRVVSYATAMKLPYLDAVIQESFRLFPAVGLLLERHVPPAGANICGEYVPGGTIVGCNAWTLHRRPEVFGADVDVFRPERWLDADADRLKTMKGTMFQFGAGGRTCIGKNISLLEVYKLIPSFLLAFDVRFADPSKDWVTENCWFVRQLGFECSFKPREHAM